MLPGQALECIDGAAGETKTPSIYNQRDLLKRINHSIVELWKVRDAIYKIKPDIKKDPITEYSNDEQRHEELSDLHRKAVKSEGAGDYESAIKRYNESLLK